MRFPKSLVALALLASASGPPPARGGSATASPPFVFDARYPASGVTPALWQANEASALSSLFALRTRPVHPDGDGDGLPDLWETAFGLDPAVPDGDADPDGDGFTNLQEFNAGTDPLSADDFSLAAAGSPAFPVSTWTEAPEVPDFSPVEVWALSLRFLLDTVGRAPDTDGDGLPDAWEILRGTDPAVSDAGADPDGDGRSNLEEYNAGTDPLSPDFWDRAAAESGAFPVSTRIRYVSGPPLVSNLFAVVRVSNVFVCDTGGLYYDWDGDGIPNWWCERFTGKKTGIDPDADPDRDGFTNLEEFTAYTDPTDPDSLFAISLEALPASGATVSSAKNGDEGPRYAVTWPSAKGRVYTLHAVRDLMATDPPEVVETLEGTGGTLAVPIVHPEDTPIRFFYLSVSLAPAE